MHTVTLVRQTSRAVDPETLRDQVVRLTRIALPATTLGRHWKSILYPIQSTQQTTGWIHKCDVGFYRNPDNPEELRHLREFNIIKVKLQKAARSSAFGGHPWEFVDPKTPKRSVPPIEVIPMHPQSSRWQVRVGSKVLLENSDRVNARCVGNALAEYQRILEGDF